jgi:uncharacterized protein YpmS
MRILKPLFRILIAVLVLGAVGLGVLYYMSRRTPSNYQPTALSQEQIDEASTRVDTQKMPRLLNLASLSHAASAATYRAKASGQPVPPGATLPAPVTVSFTQDEINSSLIKWSRQYADTIDRYVTAPYVAIEKDRIVLMATVPELGRVVSMHLAPEIDDRGRFRCDATSVYLGSLPLPNSMFVKYRTQLEGSLKARMPLWQRTAKMDPGGAVNPDARALLLSRLALSMLNGEPGAPFLYLPHVREKTGKEHKDTSVAVRLTEVTIEKGVVTITVQPTGPEERATIEQQLRQPLQSAAADTLPNS